ncbi:hypothetical protein K3495_g6195 [Podosphaera aphanis]|nr:hypothetical protein K3495_g6195 [Podosphaera aphanis]
MSSSDPIFSKRNLDALSINLESFKHIPELTDTITQYLDGDFGAVVRSPASEILHEIFIDHDSDNQEELLKCRKLDNEVEGLRAFIIGSSAFNCFLQVNVTGPVASWGSQLPRNSKAEARCLASLEVDGVSVYQDIPYVNLFCLARAIFTVFFPRTFGTSEVSCRWMRLRVHVFHQRLLAHSAGGRLRDADHLQTIIEQDLLALDAEVFGSETAFSSDAQVQFLQECAQIYIMYGREIKAKESLERAVAISGFRYAMSGALGKRTKYQQDDTSQLVVIALSKDSKQNISVNSSESPDGNSTESATVPVALDLNDDTLLESISFSKSSFKTSKTSKTILSAELASLKPDEQPQLQPLDQITLLIEATFKDTLSPHDNLKCEEILPYATRVLGDKPANWQIYTQALLVRSRIESHRSRTQERSILQLQAIVDQIIADTQQETSTAKNSTEVPEIRVTTFLPKAKPSESAPVQERLKFIHQLGTPTRWELETELAYAWSSAGSLVTALEIFKRLKLWGEVSLCYHSISQEEKARQVIRRQLFYSDKGECMDKYDIDAAEISAEKWQGALRPTPPHAPRYWCILGDLDNDPKCWQYAWEISKYRYARAQRSLGEYFIKSGDLVQARDAYMQASVANRQNIDTWSRLGDIDLKLGNWNGAIIAFQQAIMLDDTNAKTYSNLGTALISKHSEICALSKGTDAQSKTVPLTEESDDEADSSIQEAQDPKAFLKQALKAYKRGASLAHTNWQIWDNVLTISLRLSPPSYPDLLLALQNLIRIRAPTLGEAAIDAEALGLLVAEAINHEHIPNPNSAEASVTPRGIYTPPRGSLSRAVLDFLQQDVLPLITTRVELYECAERMALYRRDYLEALDFAEKAWRSLIQDEVWLVDADRWTLVFRGTERLADALENYGSMPVGDEGAVVEEKWRMKAKRAIRTVLGRARDAWEESENWRILQRRLDELQVEP